MRRYFITGGTGFIGREIVRQLLRRDDTELVMCLTRGRSDLIMDRRVEYWKGDICDVDLPRHKFTDVIHAAAEANDLLHPDQIAYYYTVVEGARRMYEWISDTHPERILFVSSGAVDKANTAYCRAKRAAEYIMRHTRARIARVYSLIGEEMPLNGQYAIGRFFGSALNGAVRYYRSEAYRSYLHVEDCARALIDTLACPTRTVSHIGAAEAVSVVDLAHKVAAVMGVPAVEEEAPAPHGSPEWYVPRFIDCEQTIELEEALVRVRDHLRHTHLEPRAAA